MDGSSVVSHAPAAEIGSLDASPDGRTLYHPRRFGGSLPAEGGTPDKLGAGDSLTVEQDTGDPIVKLEESARIRLRADEAHGRRGRRDSAKG